MVNAQPTIAQKGAASMVDQTKPITPEMAVKMAQSANVATFVEKDENGFTIISDKNKLVGRPFTIVATEAYEKMAEGDAARGLIEGLKVYIVTKNGQTAVFTDTSSGVYRQLSDYTGPLPVNIPNGLRRSDYRTSHGPASTFYLDF